MKNQINVLVAGTTVNVFINNKLHKKNCSSKENAKRFYDTVIEAKKNPTEDNISEIYTYLNKGFRVTKENGLQYNLETNEVFFNDFNTPIPQTLVNTIEDYHENGMDLEPLVNFWKLLMANPDKRVREDLFKFIKTYDFSITDNGYLVVYKAVEWYEKEVNNLQTFVTNTAYHVRKDWKKSPKAYVVYKELESDTFKFTKEETFNSWNVDEKRVEFVGNLKDLEDSIDLEENKEDEVAFIPRYTKWNKRGEEYEKEKIVLGVPRNMDRTKCDSDPKHECSYGLHVGATSYVRHFTSSRTSPVLVCLVNPMNVIAVPEYDNSKMRVSSYFPMAILNRDENGDMDVVEQSYFESDYIDYEKEELEKLIEEIKNEERGIIMDSNAPEDDRDIDEILKVLQSRVVDIG